MSRKWRFFLCFLLWAVRGLSASPDIQSRSDLPHADSELKAPKAVVRSGNYRLSANDMTHIKVFQEDELETITRIAKDGSITLPLIGSVRIGGCTVEEAAQAIRERL